MIGSSFGELGLPQIAQIGFAVRDLDAAIAFYEPLFGPFKRAPAEFACQEASYKGAPRSPYELKIAFGHSGDVEIELIQWVSGDTPHRDFIQNGREGMHHVQFRIDDCDAWVAKLNAAGYETVWYDRLTPDVAYAYLERPGDPLIVEFLEFPASGDATEGVKG
jgi:catechol 2,3-dioxygenase-like lactoylglutathione lyase family enzyme